MDCLNQESGEIVVLVKMQATRGWTERPREALLQLDIVFRYFMYRIGGRLRIVGASLQGATGGIPPLEYWGTNGLP